MTSESVKASPYESFIIESQTKELMEGQSQDVGQTVLNTKKGDDQVGSAEYFVCLFSDPAVTKH